MCMFICQATSKENAFIMLLYTALYIIVRVYVFNEPEHRGTPSLSIKRRREWATPGYGDFFHLNTISNRPTDRRTTVHPLMDKSDAGAAAVFEFDFYAFENIGLFRQRKKKKSITGIFK